MRVEYASTIGVDQSGGRPVIDDITKRELTGTFTRRNVAAHEVPTFAMPDSWVPVPDFWTAAQRRPITRDVKFSMPGYSNTGEAIVYANYMYGGECCESWLFLLKKTEVGWQVTLVTTVAIY